jgi:hypothetical protein
MSCILIRNYFEDIGNKMFVPQDKHYVAENIIIGASLNFKELNSITKNIKFTENEKIEVLYSNNDSFEYKKNILVGITNFRIFKLENNNISYIDKNNIVSIRYRYNGIFRWDKIECKLRNGEFDTIGVFHSNACRYLCNYLNHKKSQTPNGVPKVEPVTERKIEPVIVPKVEPVTERKIEPVIKRKIEPVAEQKAEPVAEPKAEPVAEQKAEPIAEPKVELVAESKAEPVAELVAEPKAELVAEPKATLVAEPKAKPKAEPKAEQKTELVAEQKTEPVTKASLQVNGQYQSDPIIGTYFTDIQAYQQHTHIKQILRKGESGVEIKTKPVAELPKDTELDDDYVNVVVDQ